MIIEKLLTRIDALGIVLEYEPGKLNYFSERPIPDDLVEEMKVNKGALLAEAWWRNRYESSKKNGDVRPDGRAGV